VPDTASLLAFIGATVVLLLIPGPAVIFILNRTLADGRTAGLTAVAGLEVGDAVQATLAAAGLSAVIATSQALFESIKWFGVAYLVWSGVRTFLTVPPDLKEDMAHVDRALVFRQGVVVNALNPKTALFFLSIFPQFVDTESAGATTQSLVLAAVFVLLATLFNSSYVLLAARLRDRLLRGSAVRVMRRWVSGALFIGLGVLSMTAARPNAQ
jgi:threonine/homoserine/homoserine lactone efflux protein